MKKVLVLLFALVTSAVSAQVAKKEYDAAPEEVKAKIVEHCAEKAFGVDEQSNRVSCTKLLRDIDAGKALLYQLLIGTRYSSEPELVVQFNITRKGSGSYVTATMTIVSQNAFGRVDRTPIKDVADVQQVLDSLAITNTGSVAIAPTKTPGACFGLLVAVHGIDSSIKVRVDNDNPEGDLSWGAKRVMPEVFNKHPMIPALMALQKQTPDWQAIRDRTNASIKQQLEAKEQADGVNRLEALRSLLPVVYRDAQRVCGEAGFNLAFKTYNEVK